MTTPPPHPTDPPAARDSAPAPPVTAPPDTARPVPPDAARPALPDAARPVLPDDVSAASAAADTGLTQLLAAALTALPQGQVRHVVTAPAHVLSRPSEPVDPTDPAIVQLAADLIATMRVSPGCVGLAAPQVGVSAQLFAVDVTGHPKASTLHGPFVLANAIIIEATRWKSAREGCMSVPDLTGDVKRAARIIVEGQLPLTGQRVTITTDAFEARALQHEIDHCQGLLFLDRVSDAHAIYQRQVYL